MSRIRLNVPLLLVVLFVGCDRTTLQTAETVTAPNGTDRLVRRDWETVSSSNPDERSYDSHSLVWQRLRNGAWVDHVTITQADFQREHNRQRWISEIHSFDPISGTAILKIAEGDAPENSGAVSYIYSWREWDVKNNRELKTIRSCDDPFEKFAEVESVSGSKATTEQTDERGPE